MVRRLHFDKLVAALIKEAEKHGQIAEKIARYSEY